ncbi:MAG: thiol protease/hemagglutinin PrtT [Lentimicrobium sp.]|nr:thiol protease/hemagglutinin PrtT [Lentimicrobium sp.]
MKKTLLLLIFLATTIHLFADSINSELAAKIATNFYKQLAKEKSPADITLSLVYSEKTDEDGIPGKKEQSTMLFYIFNVNQNDGYVIVTADNDVTPILGYALSGSYLINDVPPALNELINKYKEEIIFVLKNKLKADNEIREKWIILENGDALNEVKNMTGVNPLLSTTWNQSPYYNDLCPFDNEFNELTVTGCVATAMAQIMKFWNFPITGSGFHSYNHNKYGTLSANFGGTDYNWSGMPNNVVSTNSAVATLVYHCGVAVEMNYGVASNGGSGAYVIDNNGANPYCAENAYKTNFGYDPSTIQGLKRVNYSDTEWKNLLKADLNTGLPIQYAGFGPNSGHTFVCDGYNNNDFFHMNWGWGGSFDGYFNLDQLNPGSYGFNDSQQAVIGIQPETGSSASIIDLYSAITITPNPIDFFQSFEVNVDLINSGTSNFNGDYCAALFNANGVFIDYVSILTTGSYPLPPGYHYTGGITFTNAGFPTEPGTFIVGVYFMDPGGEWQLAGSSTYTNPITTSINSPYNLLEQYSDITAAPAPLVQGQSATIHVNLYNTNTYTYIGQYQAALFDLNGNFVETIGIYNETEGLPSGYTYAEPYLAFTTTAITAEPGTYLLAIIENEAGYSYWYFVGGSYYLTPVYIDVVATPLLPDIYEPNNTENTAFNFQVNFSGNTATPNTIGSNIHAGADLDYYQINLASGYDYSITARVHDSYNSGNGQTYTCDVLFSYKNGAIWSETFDDVMPSTINVSNGGTVLFHVGPYFAAQTGTYLLDLNITRTNLAPGPAGAISGPSAVCQGQNSVTYTVPLIVNATSYIWTLPNGSSGSSSSNSIDVSFSTTAVSGNIIVYGNNSTGNGAPSSLAINVNPLPANAGPISGETTVCQGQNSVYYTVPAITNANSYTWILPNGASGSSSTNSITVNYGQSAVSGNITVNGVNSCGNGILSSLPVVVNIKPVQPTISLNGYVLHSSAPNGNQWYNQTGPIYGATSQNYTVTSSGDYYVIVTLAGCSSNSSNSINVIITGQETMGNKSALKAYPNPFSEVLIIEKEENISSLNFVIINSVGQLIHQGIVIDKVAVKTSNFAPGIYLLKLENGNHFELIKMVKEW